MLKDKYGANVVSRDRASSMTVWISREESTSVWRLTVSVEIQPDFDVVFRRDVQDIDEIPFALEYFRNRRWFGRYVTSEDMKLVFKAVVQLIDQGLDDVFESSHVFGHLVDD